MTLRKQPQNHRRVIKHFIIGAKFNLHIKKLKKGVSLLNIQLRFAPIHPEIFLSRSRAIPLQHNNIHNNEGSNPLSGLKKETNCFSFAHLPVHCMLEVSALLLGDLFPEQTGFHLNERLSLCCSRSVAEVQRQNDSEKSTHVANTVTQTGLTNSRKFKVTPLMGVDGM